MTAPGTGPDAKPEDATMEKNEKALDRFLAIVGEIRTATEAIQKSADDHFDLTPDEIHWGHVGDAGRTLEGLKEVLAVIRGEQK